MVTSLCAWPSQPQTLPDLGATSATTMSLTSATEALDEAADTAGSPGPTFDTPLNRRLGYGALAQDPSAGVISLEPAARSRGQPDR